MPFLDGLDFVNQAFDVSYRASQEPQELDIEIETAAKSARRSGPVCLRKVIDMINFGAAGGVLFSPAAGHAERLRGPWDGADAFGPTYHWTVRIAGVAPEFLRLAIEHLRRAGWDQPVRSMRIRGELAPDRSPASVTTARARGWLSDTTYPGLWPHTAFVLRGHDVPGAQLRVTLLRPVSGEEEEALQAICARWLQLTATIVGQDGSPIVRTAEQLERMLPVFSVAGNVFSAMMNVFGHAAEPAAALLANMLARFSMQRAEIAEAVIGISGLHAWPPAPKTPEPRPKTKAARPKMKAKRKEAAKRKPRASKPRPDKAKPRSKQKPRRRPSA